MNRLVRLVGLKLAARRPEPTMNLARSVADVLAEHVSFELECIDRMYCNVYQPRLQHVGGVVGYVRHHLGLPDPQPCRWWRSRTGSSSRSTRSLPPTRSRGLI